MTATSDLYRKQVEDVELDAASVVIVHLALGKLPGIEQDRIRTARKMGANLFDLCEALSLDSGLTVDHDDFRTAVRYSDESKFAEKIDRVLPNEWELRARGCRDWSEVMRALFPDNPASQPVPRPDTVEEVQGKIARASSPNSYVIRKGGVAYVAPAGTPLGGPGWAELGSVSEDGLTVEEPKWMDIGAEYGFYNLDQMGVTPEVADCGAPIVHHASKQGCQECPCPFDGCGTCSGGNHIKGGR